MNSRTMPCMTILRILSLVALSSALCACASDATDASGGTTKGNETTPSEPESAAETAALVASLELENGNTVEFYDFGRGAMITESGEAYSEPMLGDIARSGDDLIGVWSKLAAKRPVPEALSKLQERLKKLHARGKQDSLEQPRADELAFEEISVAAEPSEGSHEKASCSNGCCDVDWLQTFPECQRLFDRSWFQPNVPGSTVNTPEITGFRGMVCSATGTSRFRYSIASFSRDIPVPEGRFVHAEWWAGNAFIGYYGHKLKSQVTVASGGGATYCGIVYLD